MTLIVTKDPQDDKMFWISNPIAGRGRWCTLGFDGVLKDTENSMFPEVSPKCYQKAYKTFIEGKG